MNRIKGVAGRKVDRNVSYQTFRGRTGTPGNEDCKPNLPVPKKTDHPNEDIVPISNLTQPSWITHPEGKEIPSKRDFTVYRLKHRIAQLEDNERQDLAKLSRALALLQEQERFYDLGLHRGQWETYTDMQQRLARIKGCIALIQDPVAMSGSNHQSTEVTPNDQQDGDILRKKIEAGKI